MIQWCQQRRISRIRTSSHNGRAVTGIDHVADRTDRYRQAPGSDRDGAGRRLHAVDGRQATQQRRRWRYHRDTSTYWSFVSVPFTPVSADAFWCTSSVWSTETTENENTKSRMLEQHGSDRSAAKLLHTRIHTDVRTEPLDTISRLARLLAAAG